MLSKHWTVDSSIAEKARRQGRASCSDEDVARVMLQILSCPKWDEYNRPCSRDRLDVFNHTVDCFLLIYDECMQIR